MLILWPGYCQQLKWHQDNWQVAVRKVFGEILVLYDSLCFLFSFSDDLTLRENVNILLDNLLQTYDKSVRPAGRGKVCK